LSFLPSMMCKPRFSLPGGWQKDLPSLFARIPRRHKVSCHRHEHERFDRLAAEEQLRRIEKATEVLQKLTATRPPGFTARDFRLTGQTIAILEQRGYAYDASKASYRRLPRQIGSVGS